jgi:hypothetical protein
MFVTGYLSPTVGDSKLLLLHLASSHHRFAVTADGNILLLWGINTDKPSSAPTIFESDDAGDPGVKRIVAADADIGAWFEF